MSWKGTALTDHAITTIEEYRELRGDAHQMNYDKSMDVLDDHIRNFLAMSTFLTVASIDADGRMDVSPKGDPPGFVRVIDDHTIAIPNGKGIVERTPSPTFYRIPRLASSALSQEWTRRCGSVAKRH